MFYSIHSLPELWQAASHFNPFFYMVDGFRYGFFGVVRRVALAAAWRWSRRALSSYRCLALLLLKSGYKLRH